MWLGERESKTGSLLFAFILVHVSVGIALAKQEDKIRWAGIANVLADHLMMMTSDWLLDRSIVFIEDQALHSVSIKQPQQLRIVLGKLEKRSPFLQDLITIAIMEAAKEIHMQIDPS